MSEENHEYFLFTPPLLTPFHSLFRLLSAGVERTHARRVTRVQMDYRRRRLIINAALT